MVEADRVPDLVSDRVAQVVNVEVTVEADFPALPGVEADHRSLDFLRPARPLGHIGEGAPFGRLLSTDQNAGCLTVGGFHEANIGSLFPEVECGAHLALEHRRG